MPSPDIQWLAKLAKFENKIKMSVFCKHAPLMEISAGYVL